MSLIDKFIKVKKESMVKSFKAGEEADLLGRKAARLDSKKDKTKDEIEQVRELRKEAEKLRTQQVQARVFSNNMGVGERIIQCYFTYKLASLACHTLVGLVGGYTYATHGQTIGTAVTKSIDRAVGKMTDKVMEQSPEERQDINQARAEMIEQTLDSFEKMSKQAEEQGLTKEGELLLSDEDKMRIKELADISRDFENAQQAEQYAAKCKELGLDYNEAMTAFQQDKTFSEIERDITIERIAEAKHERSM